MDEMLQYAIENGIIDMSYVKDKIEMNKREEILKSHPYSVWKGKNGKWYTYVPNKEKDRGKQLVKRNTEDDIRDAIVKFWKEEKKKQDRKEELESKKTVRDVYFLWREVQDKLVSQNTIAKYDTDYNRFFDGKDFFEMDIREVTEDDIKIYLCQIIKEIGLLKEPMRKLFGYLRNTIMYARKKGYISGNPMEFLQPKDFSKYCSEKFKTVEEMVISNEDLNSLQERFEKDHEEFPEYIPTYAVEFAVLTGMRVGEIAALTWDCVKDDYIIVDKSEKSDNKKKKFWIEQTKNKIGRMFPLTDDIRDLLKRVERIEKEYGFYCEWIFANENGRIHAPIISSCSKTKCRQLGIRERGIHAYRKTLNSHMRNNGVSSAVAASILGHTPEVNEKYYTFDITNIKEKASIVSAACERKGVTYGVTSQCAASGSPVKSAVSRN